MISTKNIKIHVAEKVEIAVPMVLGSHATRVNE